jgi:hypothetical protein
MSKLATLGESPEQLRVKVTQMDDTVRGLRKGLAKTPSYRQALLLQISVRNRDEAAAEVRATARCVVDNSEFHALVA